MNQQVNEKYQQIVETWQSKNIHNANSLQNILGDRSILFAYNSTTIEDNAVKLKDVITAFSTRSLIEYTGPIRAVLNINNAYKVWKEFLKAYDRRAAISEELVKNFQRLITEDTYSDDRLEKGEAPGEYKKGFYVVGDEVGASPEETPFEMEELIEDFNDTNFTKEQALTAAAYFHCKFENIHPFSDGNGRTGRLMLNYILVNNNLPPVIIHADQESRERYYEALNVWNEEQSLAAMVDLLKEQTVKTWDLEQILNYGLDEKAKNERNHGDDDGLH
jgi:Fic family protein